VESELGFHCAGASSARRNGAPHFVLIVQEALRRSPALDALEATWATPPPADEESRTGQRLDIIQVARRCGLSLFYVPAARNGHEQRDGSGEDKGNAILSTLSLSDFIAAELPFESARRVVVGATVHDAAGGSLRVLSVHLITTPQAWRMLTTANSSRARQASAILRTLESIEQRRALPGSTSPNAPPISTVVAGDFNTWSVRESALRNLLDHFPESPRPLMERTRGPFPTDHLLFRGRRVGAGAPDSLVPGSYRRVENRFHSDHKPIVALFRFGSEAVVSP
jgi:endonuclease/exonuclease/phosphatase family metal-dependent hydrolase